VLFPLTAGTALIGHDSWADGRIGDFFRLSSFLERLHPHRGTPGLKKLALWKKLNSLAIRRAAYLDFTLGKAHRDSKDVLVLYACASLFVQPVGMKVGYPMRIICPIFACQAVGTAACPPLCVSIIKKPDLGDPVLNLFAGHTH